MIVRSTDIRRLTRIHSLPTRKDKNFQSWPAITRRSFTRSNFDDGVVARERMRVAVIGGGVAGLSSALHLAPLVSQGLISGPIDIYEASGGKGRDIGVGIWSTGLDPFMRSHRDSHQLVYQDMVQRGTWVGDVGYRTPKGHWLSESSLDDNDLPHLLFLRESDLITSLRKAVHLEEQLGTLSFHSGNRHQIESIYDGSSEPWSAPLLLKPSDSSSSSTDADYTTQIKTPRDYHLIIDGSGSESIIRKTFGGYQTKKLRLTGATALSSSPLDLPTGPVNVQQESWDEMGQAEATCILDREYTVFRGNANITREEMKAIDKQAKNNYASFQTWGEGRSMRFATVPMLYPSAGKGEERQVWFITINDDDIANTDDPEERRKKLLNAFADWHDPIRHLVEATDPEDIIMERAMAHKHCMSPVSNFNEVIRRMRRRRPPNAGNGPAIVFVGDAFMTIDPILAQGFTMGMEGAAALAQSVSSTVSNSNPRVDYPNLAFDPNYLRVQLETRHERRLGRLICLLRATELVQALGQPNCGTFTGMLSRDLLRPLMRLTPNVIKTPLFNRVLKYSLGVQQGNS